MSNTGTTELDVGRAESNNQTIAQAFPTRLKPIDNKKGLVPKPSKLDIGYQYVREVVNEYRQTEHKLFCTNTPLYLQQLESLGLSMSVEGEDQVLTRIANLAKSLEHRIDVVIRLKAIDYLGIADKNKRTVAEFFTYQKLIQGFDKRGQPIGSAYVTVNQDYNVPIRQEFSEDDEPLTPLISGPKFSVYTTLWNQSEFDRVMENQDPSHKVQFIVSNGNSSWSGFSLDEFRDCSFAELEMRGKTGFINQPTDIEISNIPKQERLNMFKSVIPKQ